MGKGKDDARGAKPKATNGDDVLVGTPRNDDISGKKGNDQISGLDGNDKLYGGKGDDRLLGGAGNDVLYGDDGRSKGWGWDQFCWWKPKSGDDDYLDGGAGSDKVYGGKGNDVAVYSMAGNLGAGFKNIGTRDDYDGGSGHDTLVLQLTHGEALLASVKQDIAAFRKFLDSRASSRGEEFEFKSFNLDVSNFEALRVELTNVGPTARDDAGATDADTLLVLAAPGLLANDSDPDHLDVLKVSGAGASALGAIVTVAANGALTYDPTASAALQALAVGTTRIDSITYTITDLGGATATATVRVSVAGTNDAPVAQDDSGMTDEESAVGGNVLANDHDPDAGDTISVSAVNGSAAGIGATITLASGALLTLNANGSYSYDPNGQFESLSVGKTATDTFEYTVSDNHGAATSAEVSIEIAGVNDLPVARDDSAATDEDTAVEVDVFANDQDADASDVLQVESFSGTSAMGATIAYNGDGKFSYDPTGAVQAQQLPAGKTTTDTFEYSVSDGHGGTASAVVTVELTGVNDAPVAVNDDNLIVDLRTFENGDTAGYLLGGFNTIGAFGVGDSWMAYAFTGNNFTDDGADGVVSRKDGRDFALLSLDVAAFVTPHSVSIAGYDDGSLVAIRIVQLDVFDGAAGYAPLVFNQDWGSLDELRFFGDGVDGVEDFTFIDNLRVATGVRGDEDTPIDLDVLANDSDPDGDALEVTAVSGSALGALVSINPNGTVNYDARQAADVQLLAAGQTATDTFTYTASDEHGATAEATVTIHLVGVNDAPVAADDGVFTVDEDGVLLGAGLLGNDHDIDSLELSAILFAGPQNGKLELHADGSFVYTPKADFHGDDSFSYVVSDGELESDVATVALSVASVNDAPVAAGDAYNVKEGGLAVSAAVGVLDNDADADGDLLATVLVDDALEGKLVLNADGSFTYLPGEDFDGEDSFTYRATDGELLSEIVTVTLTGAAGNSPPDAVNDTASTDEDTVVTGNVLTGGKGGRDSDPDGDALAVTTTGTFTTLLGASVTLDPNGAFRYDPRGSAALQALNGEQSQVDSFEYSISDGHGGTDSATLSVTVAGRAEASSGGSGKVMSQIEPGSEGVQYYVSFEGVAGGGWLELDAWSFGFDADSVVVGGSGARAGRASAQDVELVLGSSKTATALANTVAAGKVVPGVTIEAYQMVEGDKQLIERIDFDNVRVTGLHSSGGGESAPTESISFVYTKFEDEFREQKDDGSFGSSKAGWDLQLNKTGSADGAPGTADGAPLVQQAGELEYYVRFDGVGSASSGQWLKLEGFSLGLENSGTFMGGGGGTTGRVAMDDVSLSLGTSSALLKLSEGLLAGKLFTNVEVEAYSSGFEGGKQLIDEFWFEGVMLTGVDRDADLSAGVTLQATKFSHDHAQQNIDGSLGAHTLAGWDFATNKAYSKADGADFDEDELIRQSGGDVQYYVSFEGVAGGGWLELDAWSFGFDADSVVVGGSGARAGRASAQDVELVLGSSKTATALANTVAAGKVVPGVTIEAYQMVEGDKQLIERIDFDNVRVTGLHSSGGGESAPTESISFVYTKFEDEFREQKDDGSFGSSKAGWDLQLNKTGSADGAPGTADGAPLVQQAGELEYYVRFDGVGSASSGQWLKLEGFSLGLENSGTFMGGGGGTTGRVAMDDVSLSLGTSSALLKLSEGLLAGKLFTNVEVEAYSSGFEGGKQLIDEFWFEGVMLTGVDRDADLSAGVTLQATKFSHDHAQQNIDGSLGAHTLAGWDFATNKAYSKADGADFDEDELIRQSGGDVQYYVSFEGVAGGGWLELDAWSFGFDADSVVVGGSGARAGRASAQDVELVLGSSKTATALANTVAAGKVVPGVTIEAYQMVEGDKQLIERIDFDNVRVTGLHSSGGGESAPTESISFVYTKFEDEFREQKDDGSFGSSKAGWDLQLNKTGSADGAPGTADGAPLVQQAGELEYYVRFDGVGSASSGQWLKLEGFSLGLENSGTFMGGGGGTTGRVAMDDVSLSLGTSSALLKLSEGLLAGKLFTNVEVEAYSSGFEGGKQLIDEFWFEGVMLTGVDRDADLSAGVTLQATKFSHDHAQQNIDGSLGAHTLAGWDFATNKAWTHPGAHADIDFF